MSIDLDDCTFDKRYAFKLILSSYLEDRVLCLEAVQRGDIDKLCHRSRDAPNSYI